MGYLTLCYFDVNIWHFFFHYPPILAITIGVLRESIRISNWTWDSLWKHMKKCELKWNIHVKALTSKNGHGGLVWQWYQPPITDAVVCFGRMSRPYFVHGCLVCRECKSSIPIINPCGYALWRITWFVKRRGISRIFKQAQCSVRSAISYLSILIAFLSECSNNKYNVLINRTAEILTCKDIVKEWDIVFLLRIYGWSKYIACFPTILISRNRLLILASVVDDKGKDVCCFCCNRRVLVPL